MTFIDSPANRDNELRFLRQEYELGLWGTSMKKNWDNILAAVTVDMHAAGEQMPDVPGEHTHFCPVRHSDCPTSQH